MSRQRPEVQLKPSRNSCPALVSWPEALGRGNAKRLPRELDRQHQRSLGSSRMGLAHGDDEDISTGPTSRESTHFLISHNDRQILNYARVGPSHVMWLGGSQMESFPRCLALYDSQGTQLCFLMEGDGYMNINYFANSCKSHVSSWDLTNLHLDLTYFFNWGSSSDKC